MFAVGGPRYPVMLLEMMLSKHPDEQKSSGPLYLTPLRKPRPDLWYSKQPVGIHTVNGFMKAVADAGGPKSKWQGIHKSYSVKKVTVQKLRKAGVSCREIIAITGHKTEESITGHTRTRSTNYCPNCTRKCVNNFTNSLMPGARHSSALVYHV